jgi:hypothetical protein
VGLLQSISPLFFLAFWGVPVAAGYWIWHQRKIAGASLFVGRLVLILWFATFPVLILSLFLGISKLEGNSVESQCSQALVMFAALIAAYVALFRSFGRLPDASASASESAPRPAPRNPPPPPKA